jgi:spermidine synthase
MNALIPFIFMGLISLLLQITVLRLLLSTFLGNELDIGITLSFWLLYVGSGSYLGKRFVGKHAFSISFLLIALLILPTAFAIKAIRPVLSLGPGELVSLSSTVLTTAIILFPLCILIGIQFPLAIAYSGAKHSPGKIYGLEAFGAFIGGMLFTFLLASRIPAFDLCLILSFMNILTASYVSRKKNLLLFLLMPLFLYIGIHNKAVTLPWQGLTITKTAESRYGEITIVKLNKQSSIFTNGHLLFSYPDVPNEEIKTHLPILLHPNPSIILIIGGSPANIKYLLKYNAHNIDFIELNSHIVSLYEHLLEAPDDKAAIHDQRVRIMVEDGRRFVKKVHKPVYDLILLNFPPPSTANINRFYTIDFFREVTHALKEDGILAMYLSTSTGYMGKSMQTANGSIYNSLKSVFRYVEVTSQEYGGIFASQSPIDTTPGHLDERFFKRGIQTGYFHSYIFHDAFSPFGVNYVKERLGEIEKFNTDMKPSAYLYNLMVWAEVQGGGILNSLLKIRRLHLIIFFAVILISLSFLIFQKQKRVISFSVFTSGFSGISFTIVIILSYQAFYGYIYEMIGMLGATFMIGLWLGTIISRRIANAMKVLFYFEILTIIFALSAHIFFKSEPLFYLLILLTGIVTGGQFNTATISIGKTELAGKLYALDLIGSFFGAFILSIILIPLFGVRETLLWIACIKTVSALMLFFLIYLPIKNLSVFPRR